MSLGIHSLPFMLLSILPLQEVDNPSDQGQVTEPSEDLPAAEVVVDPPAPVPTELSPVWLGVPDESWRPLDDPGAVTLPDPLLKLEGKREAAYEAISSSCLLLVRSFPSGTTGIDAFVADEEVMGRTGEFIPVADGELESASGRALTFDCEWTWLSLTARVSTLYAQSPTGEWISLWIISADLAPFEELQAVLAETLARFNERDGLAALDRYSAYLNGHEFSFNLNIDDQLQLQPTGAIDGQHARLLAGVLELNVTMLGSHARQWRDEKRGVTLSYQILSHDVAMGPKTPFVEWLGSGLQSELRVDVNKGDTPIELIHLENARTETVSDEALEKHYKNCERTDGPGVILEVYLPQSPLARACRLRWRRPLQGTPEKFGRAWFVELRRYHLSRGELVTGVSIVMLRAEAPTKQALDLMEAALDFRAQPNEPGSRFPGLE
jgi:hypothetical protein